MSGYVYLEPGHWLAIAQRMMNAALGISDTPMSGLSAFHFRRSPLRSVYSFLEIGDHYLCSALARPRARHGQKSPSSFEPVALFA
jgi:hypothetical protein